MKKKKILITGVAGFIGFSLAKKIIQSKKPKTRYLITRNYINYFLSRIIPDRILDRIIGKKLDLF